jgi:hypothetical protein
VRLRGLSLTSWLAFALVVLGLVFVAIAIAFDSLDAWAQNLATEAFAIALTIAIVERIVRREARGRLRPRVNRALSALNANVRIFLEALAYDYAQTHIDTFRPLPAGCSS